MPFAEKLATLRKDRGLTQEELAKKIGVGIAQMRRYEKGASSPTLEIIKNMAKTLGISSDELIFDESEGVASTRILDSKLLEQFEILSKMNLHDKEAIMTIMDSMIIKNKIQEVLPVKPETKDSWGNRMRKVTNRLRKGAEGYSEDEVMKIVDEAVEAVRREDRKRKRKAS